MGEQGVTVLIGVYFAVMFGFVIAAGGGWEKLKGSIRATADFIFKPPKTDRDRSQEILALEHDTIFPLGEDPAHCRLCSSAVYWRQASCPTGHDWEDVTMTRNGVPFRVDHVCTNCGHREVVQ